eukprot:TRINITY_DN4196_c0_g1_i1.p1 TRINITY_DN4196_c0_g1~~TRINITY_DN4196_c0_g1_i1.p1  ORF type:complete len:106 (+),score=18.22 TRINITY_DN4196_c0_g1_i1:184-501(+)
MSKNSNDFCLVRVDWEAENLFFEKLEHSVFYIFLVLCKLTIWLPVLNVGPPYFVQLGVERFVGRNSFKHSSVNFLEFVKLLNARNILVSTKLTGQHTSALGSHST